MREAVVGVGAGARPLTGSARRSLCSVVAYRPHCRQTSRYMSEYSRRLRTVRPEQAHAMCETRM